MGHQKGKWMDGMVGNRRIGIEGWVAFVPRDTSSHQRARRPTKRPTRTGNPMRHLLLPSSPALLATFKSSLKINPKRQK